LEFANNAQCAMSDEGKTVNKARLNVHFHLPKKFRIVDAHVTAPNSR